MQQEITEVSATAAAASGFVKAAPPVAVSGALTMGVGVPELIQYLTLLWLVYQFVDAIWTGVPKWRLRFQTAMGLVPQMIDVLKGIGRGKSKE